jgi:hypothetical protein
MLGVPAEIQNQLLPNINSERYRCSDRLGRLSFQNTKSQAAKIIIYVFLTICFDVWSQKSRTDKGKGSLQIFRRKTRRHITEENILQSYSHESLKANAVTSSYLHSVLSGYVIR